MINLNYLCFWLILWVIMKKYLLNQLLVLPLLFISFVACSKSGSLVSSSGKNFTSDQVLKQIILHKGVDLSLNDGKSVEQHKYEQEHSGELL